jgi:hypothetical protein
MDMPVSEMKKNSGAPFVCSTSHRGRKYNGCGASDEQETCGVDEQLADRSTHLLRGLFFITLRKIYTLPVRSTF